MQLRIDARLRCCALLLVELQYFQRVSQQGLRVVSEESGIWSRPVDGAVEVLRCVLTGGRGDCKQKREHSSGLHSPHSLHLGIGEA